jgi:hypothetical protein
MLQRRCKRIKQTRGLNRPHNLNTMEMPIIIAVIIGVIYFALVILLHIIREWWQMKNDQIREVNEAERPAIVKPKRFYKGKGL